MARKFSELRDRMNAQQLKESENMTQALEVRFTHPLSHKEMDALTREGKVVPPDWSESITIAAANVRTLEDALPGSNRERVKEALLSLEKQTANLRAFLEYRKAL